MKVKILQEKVTVGNVTVHFYPTRKGERTYWIVKDFSTGRRRLLNCKSQEAARTRALEVANAIQHGKTELLTLDKADLAILLQARLILRSNGLPVSAVVNAVNFYMERGNAIIKPKLLSDAITEFIASHRASRARLIALESYLNGLAHHFSAKSVHEVDQADVKRWLATKQWGPKNL